MKDALERDGERAVCERLGLSRLTVTKIGAGLPVYPGSVALAAARLGIENA